MSTNSEIHSEVWILEFLGFSSGENKKKEKQEKRRAHYKKNRRKIIQKVLEAWKKSQEARYGPMGTWTVFVLQGKFFLRENIIDQTYKLLASASRNCTLYLWCLDIKGKETANISSSIEWTQANISISLTFLQLTCFFCCKYICSFKLKFLLKNSLRGINT